jgi:hypothetical protein
VKFWKKFGGVGTGGGMNPEQAPELPELEEALSDFRLSVHGWSDAVYSRPRKALTVAPRRMAWRMAAGWATSCLLAAGLSGGVYEHHWQEMKTAQARIVERERQVAEQRARQEELLAKADSELAMVDNDVSRAVPSAMEPLAQLMAEDTTP